MAALAFVPLLISSLLVVVIILAVVFCVIFGVGAVVTIVSLIKRKKAALRGETPKRAGLITGIIIMLMPVVAVIVIVLFFALGKGSESYARAKEYRDTLAAGVESSDAEMIYSAFSPEAIANDDSLTAEINDMLDFINGDVESMNPVLPSENCEEYDEDGDYKVVSFHGNIDNIVTGSGKRYRIVYYGYSKDDEHPEKLGIDRIVISDGSGRVEIGISDNDE